MQAEFTRQFLSEGEQFGSLLVSVGGGERQSMASNLLSRRRSSGLAHASQQTEAGEAQHDDHPHAQALAAGRPGEERDQSEAGKRGRAVFVNTRSGPQMCGIE